MGEYYGCIKYFNGYNVAQAKTGQAGRVTDNSRE